MEEVTKNLSTFFADCTFLAVCYSFADSNSSLLIQPRSAVLTVADLLFSSCD